MPASSLGPVAVGTGVTACPPHRTRRAQLRHRAPTSGMNVVTPDRPKSSKRCPVDGPVCVTCDPGTESGTCQTVTIFPSALPLCSIDSTTSLPLDVRRLHRSYLQVRLLPPVHHRITAIRPSRCGPPDTLDGQAGDLPVSGKRASVRARVYDHAEQWALA